MAAVKKKKSSVFDQIAGDARKDAAAAPKASQDQLGLIGKLVEERNTYLDEVEVLKARLEEKNAQILEIETKKLPQAMRDAHTKQHTTLDGFIITLKSQWVGYVKNEDKPEFYKWLRSKELGDIIKNEVSLLFGQGQDKLAAKILKLLRSDKDLKKLGLMPEQSETIHGSTWKSFINRVMTEGKISLPTNLVNVNQIEQAEIKQAKQKKEK